jgi:hypothetical protein
MFSNEMAVWDDIFHGFLSQPEGKGRRKAKQGVKNEKRTGFGGNEQVTLKLLLKQIWFIPSSLNTSKNNMASKY